MADEAAAEAQGGEVATEDEGDDATTSKNKRMAKQNKPGKNKGARGKGKRKRRLGSVVYAYPRKPPIGPSYSPCPHRYFQHSVAKRSMLNQKKYDELLATPRSEPWKEPEEELQKYRRRLITPRTECLAMPQKRKMKAHLDEFSNVLTPQMVDNLEELLKAECELPPEDVSKGKAKKKAKKKKQAKKKTAVKKGKGARAAVPPAKGAKTEDGELEDEEEEEGEEGAVEAEAATEDETAGGDGTGVETEEAAGEGEAGAGEGEVEGEVEGGGGGEGEEGEVEDEGEGEEGEGEAEAGAEAEEKKLTESQLKLQKASRPIVEYAKWLEESLSKATLWAGWISDTVAEAEVKAAKKKGTVLAKDGTPKKLTCKEWNTWKEQLNTNVNDWQSTKQDILQSAKNWNKFLQIRADKIKAGESFSIPNPQAWQETYGKLSSPRVSKS